MNTKSEADEKLGIEEKYNEEQPHTPFNIMKKRLERSCQKSTGQKSTQSKRKRPGDHTGSRKHLKEMLKIAQGKEKREKQMLVS